MTAVPPTTGGRASDRPAAGRPTVEVLAPGPLALVQDRGRPGYAAVGVPRSGAVDLGALRLGNRLVGNLPDAAGLELLLGGADLRFARTTVVALTGAVAPAWLEPAPSDPVPDPTTTDSSDPEPPPAAIPVPPHTAVRVPPGAVLRIAAATRGLRVYLSVRGGIDVPAVLGSRSADVLSGLGPAPLAVGDLLPVGDLGRDLPELAPAPARVWSDPAVLTVRPGPRADWFAPGALATLLAGGYRVTPASNRTALRLDGPVLDRLPRGELPSEGLVRGAVQVPPDGRPVLFLADHPVTGGYPVLATVVGPGLDAAAQLRPGDPVRFTLLP
ncbi:5-oxoprolinase subunit C family protein [Cellulomonas hominis]